MSKTSEKSTLKFNSELDIQPNGDFNYKLEASGNIVDIFELIAKTKTNAGIARELLWDKYSQQPNE